MNELTIFELLGVLGIIVIGAFLVSIFMVGGSNYLGACICAHRWLSFDEWRGKL